MKCTALPAPVQCMQAPSVSPCSLALFLFVAHGRGYNRQRSTATSLNLMNSSVGRLSCPFRVFTPSVKQSTLSKRTVSYFVGIPLP